MNQFSSNKPKKDLNEVTFQTIKSELKSVPPLGSCNAKDNTIHASNTKHLTFWVGGKLTRITTSLHYNIIANSVPNEPKLIALFSTSHVTWLVANDTKRNCSKICREMRRTKSKVLRESCRKNCSLGGVGTSPARNAKRT